MKDEVAEEASAPIPDTVPGTSSWLRILAREVNTYVLFMHTWSAMGFVVSPELIGSLLDLQDRILAVRKALTSLGARAGLDSLSDSVQDIADREERVFRSMMEEIKKFKDETEDLFPAFKLNFDPCF
ncbi:MAG: hypothetical protein ACE5LS_05630 [Thermoplasmata archaeon]